MSFLNPAFLGALALVGVPLLIHLIRKRKLRVVTWAAMEFLQQSSKKQRRRLRIEELILLALRMLIVAVAVAAFARPVLKALGVPFLAKNARVYAVIVLDNSYSMDYRGADGKTRFQQAQAAANEILGHILKPGDSAALILLSDTPETVIGEPSFDLRRVRDRAMAAKVSDRATDYAATALAVNKLLKASRTPDKEVYWITDDQASAWESSRREAAHSVWEEMGRLARLTWVSLSSAGDTLDNLAVAPPLLGRETVTPGLPDRIEARILNHSAKASPNVTVNLVVDEKPVGSTRVSLPPHGEATAHFLPIFPQSGSHAGRIELADAAHADGLPRDNSAPFVVRSRNRLRVLVQDSHPVANAAKSDSFYLMTALAPDGATDTFLPKLREGRNLNGVNLRDYDVIVLTGLSGLEETDRRALSEWVQAGGGLLLFPDTHDTADGVNRTWSASGLMPARLGPTLTFTPDNATSLNPGTITHPALALFQDTATLNLGTARFSRIVSLFPLNDESDPNNVQTMIRYGTGDPAFVERHVRRGTVILAGMNAGTEGSELPLKTSYVPLVYQLVSYLGQGPTARRNLHPTEPFTLALRLQDANKSVRVTTPDGRTLIQKPILDEQGARLLFDDTARAGIYRVHVEGGTQTRSAQSMADEAFAVSLPENESDLTPRDPASAVTQAGYPVRQLTVAATPAQLSAAVHRARYGTEVWRWLVWTLIPMLFLESYLARYFGRRG